MKSDSSHDFLYSLTYSGWELSFLSDSISIWLKKYLHLSKPCIMDSQSELLFVLNFRQVRFKERL
jgi:hypothetical protein